MPVIELHSPQPSPADGDLAALAAKVTHLLGIPSGHCWIIWHQVAGGHHPRWSARSAAAAPIGFVTCKESYPAELVGKLLLLLKKEIAALLTIEEYDVYLATRRAHAGELLVRDAVWTGEQPDAGPEMVQSRPIGWVRGGRTELIDDNWAGETSVISLDCTRFDERSLWELGKFSHLEVVFHFHRVPPEKIETGARYPRGNKDWPMAGIFAQRGKNRPNRLGVSRCRLLRTDELDLHVAGLDAVDGTPVLDIKPYMVEFAAQGEVMQPDWSHEIMRDYY